MIKLEKIEGTEVYKFSLEGGIDEKSAHEFTKLIVEKAKEHQVIKVLGVVNQFPVIENFAAFKEVVKMKFDGLKTVGKYAILRIVFYQINF